VVAVAQLVGGVHDIARQALFARLDDRIPRRASEVTFGVILVAATASLLMPADGSRLVWLVATILTGELVAAGLVLTRLRRAIRPERFLDQRTLAAVLVATLAMLPVTAAVWWIQHFTSQSQLETLAVLVAGGIAALAVYALVLRATMPRPANRPGANPVERRRVRGLGVARLRCCSGQARA
jgi:peptidoglycan biosynthesis protein MviN/MurJ (putative lipid II flippase)